MLVAIVAITPTNIAITPRYGWVLSAFEKISNFLKVMAITSYWLVMTYYMLLCSYKMIQTDLNRWFTI